MDEPDHLTYHLSAAEREVLRNARTASVTVVFDPATLLKQRDALMAALEDLVGKLDAIKRSNLDDIFFSAFNHGLRYNGPDYKAEWERARTLLAEIRNGAKGE